MSEDELSEKFSIANRPGSIASTDSDEHQKIYVDSHRWRASEPPEEVFNDSDLNREWGFDIIGEEVDENGNVRYEVRWDDWIREDGTRTTWQKSTTISPDHWKREQRKIRKHTASESLQIDVITTTDIHNVETYLVDQAYKEKMKRSETIPQTNLLLELAKFEAKHQEQDDNTSPGLKRNNQRASTRQKSEISLANSVRGVSIPRPSTRRSQSDVSSIPSTSNFHKSTELKSSLDEQFSASPTIKAASQKNDPSCGLKKRTGDETKMRPSSSLENIPPPKRRRLSTDASSPAAQRSQLTKEWTALAAREKAAPICFLNTTDSEPVPALPPRFSYLESEYLFSSGVPRPAQMEDFLVKCSSPYCVTAASCECQAASTLLDESGRPMLAYTSDGYFAFNVPKGTEVVECNKLCGCSLKTCRNRVSQRPRDVPIEVFKTESRGWGVRSSVNVRRGKVLGLYTGFVIPRETARSLPDHDYVFDLDGDENDEDRPLHHPLFSVNSKSCGNWTRFINHSCSPNLQIYLLARDVPPANGLPFIAFVAMVDIPAKTEFTFDYDPRAAERIMLARKDKKKGVVPKGAKICACGTEACRGIL